MRDRERFVGLYDPLSLPYAARRNPWHGCLVAQARSQALRSVSGSFGSPRAEAAGRCNEQAQPLCTPTLRYMLDVRPPEGT